MSATFSHSSQTWKPPISASEALRRAKTHRTTVRASWESAPSTSLVWENLIAFVSLVALVGMIAFLVLR